MRRYGFANLGGSYLLKELHEATVVLMAMPVEALATAVWKTACTRQQKAFQAWFDYLFDRSCQKGDEFHRSAA